MGDGYRGAAAADLLGLSLAEPEEDQGDPAGPAPDSTAHASGLYGAMSAIVQTRYGSADVLRLGHVDRPRPRDEEVLVRVHAAGLDRGTWHFMAGKPYLFRLSSGLRRPRNPILGLDVAGTVVAIGARVTKFAVGDEVFGIARGSFAEYACAREDKLVRKPADLSFEQAAVVAVAGLAALQSLRDAGRLKAGQHVLIVGASGGVGSYAVQIARAMGAQVTGVCSTAKVELVRSLGAHQVVDYTREDFAQTAIRYDLVLDIGGSSSVSRLLKVLRPHGTLVMVGGEGGDPWTGMGRQLRGLLLSPFRRQRVVLKMPNENADDLEHLARLTQAGSLTPHVDRTFSLDGMPEAMRYLEAGHARGKIAISVGPKPLHPAGPDPASGPVRDADGRRGARGSTVAPSTRSAPVAAVVLGSLLTGFLAAVALVVLPFAGERENVVSAAILLAFASGWAILGVLSRLFTAQPQRWTVLPAGLMAGTAALLLGWPAVMSHALFGWLWPPVLLALVAWMVVRSRRSLRSRASLAFLFPVFGVLLVSALGGCYETISEALARNSHAMPGQLVDVGDHRLHISCSGTGSPTVVLEAGLGEFSSTMSGWIAPAVAEETRVCVYDRAGRGWSEPAASPEDGVAVATALHALLEGAGEPGPYVLAGHSAGGIYVLNFAKLFPEDVVGVVLIDSMHPEQYERLPAWPAFYQTFKRATGVLPSLARIGVPRIMSLASGSSLPASAGDERRDLSSTPAYYRSLRDEFAALRTALAQGGQLTSLGNTPLIVLTADKGAQEGWQPLQDDLARLSSNSIHRHVPDATHASLVEDERFAAASSQAVLDVVGSVRSAR
jgi:NADPH:quinone reductase-like Zn-dependent oxidoreductase/pimeloyl-ACP methyl ester carboxylesterase